MKSGSIFLIMLMALSPIYALEDNESVYINGVTFYNILLASKPVLVGETDYPQAYFDIISSPNTRGEFLLFGIWGYTKTNWTKENEIIESLLKRDKRTVKEDSGFSFKDQPDYKYRIFPYGILVIYNIPKGKKLTIEEYHAEKTKFLRETTERIRELKIDSMLDLRDDIFSYTVIEELSRENNETYRLLTKGIDYNSIKYQHQNVTFLFPKRKSSVYDRISDVISIGTRERYLLEWYAYLIYSEYIDDDIEKINFELNEISKDLENIRFNLSGNLNSTQAFSILEYISMPKNDTIKNKLDELFVDIKSVDYFVKISKEIKNRHRAEWVDVLFGFVLNENLNRSKQVNDLYQKYNLLEKERQDLFDITVAIYSAALQREGVARQLNENRISTEKQIENSRKMTMWTIIATVILATLINGVIQKYFQGQQSKHLKELTQKQTESYEKNMQKLIDEIRKPKFKEQNYKK